MDGVFMQRSSSFGCPCRGQWSTGVLSLQHRDTSSIISAVQPVEPRQGDTSVVVDVAVGSLVHPLDQVLLVQQWVVGAEGAGCIEKPLIVMAELRLPARRKELVDVYHLTQ